MAKVKPLAQSADKWKRGAANATVDYEQGIQQSDDWEQATAAAEERYKQGVTAAAQRGAFAKGVRGAGNAKWKERAMQLGSQRFSQGVAAAEGAYQQGFQPYHNALSSVTLPGKYAKGDDRNIERVKAVNKAMRAVKLQQS